MLSEVIEIIQFESFPWSLNGAIDLTNRTKRWYDVKEITDGSAASMVDRVLMTDESTRMRQGTSTDQIAKRNVKG
jgi:hypothetical protein